LFARFYTQPEEAPKMLSVGIDLHSRRFNVCVLDGKGEVLFEQLFPTSAQNLVRVMKNLADPKRVVLEESDMAAWAFRVLQPHARQVIVADPTRNRWIAGDENVSDISSARKLAQLLRGGFIHPVHHHGEEQQVFKELVLFYYDTTYDIVRVKNRLKAKLRQHGVVCGTAAIYGPEREAWLTHLTHPGARLQAELLLARLDALEIQKQRLEKELRERSRDFPIIAAWQELPGIGLIRAATFFALLGTPQRFANKRKVWAYCRLSVVGRDSGQSTGPRHLARRGSGLLKAVLKGAALSAIRADDNQFRRQYYQLLRHGVSVEHAWLTVARAIGATMFAMWRDNTPYRPRQLPAVGPLPAGGKLRPATVAS
jgi:transposase